MRPQTIREKQALETKMNQTRKECIDMTRKQIENQYPMNDWNCAERVLHGADQAHGLDIPEESFKLIGGFGGGMGCERTCGALCGAVAAIGQKYITGSAHQTAGLKDACADMVHTFERELGSIECAQLKKRHRREDTGCRELILRAGELLDQVIARCETTGESAQ